MNKKKIDVQGELKMLKSDNFDSLLRESKAQDDEM